MPAQSSPWLRTDVSTAPVCATRSTVRIRGSEVGGCLLPTRLPAPTPYPDWVRFPFKSRCNLPDAAPAQVGP